MSSLVPQETLYSFFGIPFSAVSHVPAPLSHLLGPDVHIDKCLHSMGSHGEDSDPSFWLDRPMEVKV